MQAGARSETRLTAVCIATRRRTCHTPTSTQTPSVISVFDATVVYKCKRLTRSYQILCYGTLTIFPRQISAEYYIQLQFSANTRLLQTTKKLQNTSKKSRSKSHSR